MTSGILAEIVDVRRGWVERQKQHRPLETFRDSVQPSQRDFRQALLDDRPSFIFECKKASPSKGLIRQDFRIEDIATTYGKYASAISVLTENDYFQGSFDNLAKVRRHVEQPILCKDFVVDPYQIWIAREAGADAVLLILAILDDHEYLGLCETAARLGMATITEVSTAEELTRALALRSPVVGINNRNLRDMTIDLQRTVKFAPQLSRDVVVISESGFYTNRQVRQYSPLVNGFLVGSSLMEESDLDLAVRRLMYGENKVCGLRSRQDAITAAAAGAVYGGLIFAEQSPRAVTVGQAAEVIPQVSLRFVGVFQDQPIDFVADVVKLLGLFAVQLHGAETPEYVEQLRTQLPQETEIWKAVAVDDAQASDQRVVDRVLIDNVVNGKRGGTGEAFDWKKLPGTDRDRWMVAGGLDAGNAAAAAQLGCLGLDFNSGVESSPGVKSAEKIKAAFEALRSY